MSQKNISTKNISLGFGFIIILLGLLGGLSLLNISNIGKNVNDIYNHPLAVSNAARNIHIHFVSMHRSMRDMILAENNEEFNQAVIDIANHERMAQGDFNVIYDRFLGDMSQVEELHENFNSWRDIRNEAIDLAQAGKKEQAVALITGRNASHTQDLLNNIQGLTLFAQGKADEFYENSTQSQQDTFFIIVALLALAGALSLLISYVVIKGIITANKELASREHLIDQNILLARLDTNGDIKEISNALCRLFGATQSEMIGRQSNFFLKENEIENKKDAIMNVVKTGQPWEGEIEYKDSEGSSGWLHSSVLPTFTENYIVSGYSNIITEITLQKKIEELSLVDNLTGLGNRRHYEMVMEKEVLIAKRYDKALTLAIMDIDYFKNYNDTYGHPEGDQALIRVSRVIKNHFNRPDDYIFRIGGEEFAFLFTSDDKEKSLEHLQSLRQAIEGMRIPHSDSRVSKHLTVSIGAASYVGNELPSKNDFYIDADRALYQAKEARNTIVVL